MKKTLVVFITFIVFFTPRFTHAEDYVMPYPSFMPGSKFYNIHSLWNRIEEYWHFGDMAKVKYHQGQADHYLIEAKTLFEYGQLALGVAALAESNDHFAKAILYEKEVTIGKKDKGQQLEQLINAGKKHTQILEEVSKKLPQEFEWQEEKSEPQTLPLQSLIKEATFLRSYANN